MMALTCGSPRLADLDYEVPLESARTYTRQVTGTCQVLSVGKFRNGAPKFWCATHAQFVRQADQTECVASGQVLQLRCLSINLDDYEGGLGIWGSLPPAIDTATDDIDAESLLRGVHVHARRSLKGKKEVDDTYDVVALFRNRQPLVVIDTSAATALVQSRIAGITTRAVHCSHCGADHIDEGWFAVNPHRKHQCLCCGREFFQKNGDSGNGIEARLSEVFPWQSLERVAAGRTIDLSRHVRARRHIRIWGAHQALVWTADRPEEAGVHVHVYDSSGNYVVDETFDKAVWGDITLDPDQVRLLMLQKSLKHLEGKVSAVACSACGEMITSQGKAAMNADTQHACNRCGEVTTSHRKLVSNPLAGFRFA